MDLWDQDMDVFAQQRTHHRASILAVSQLACLGTHTITGLLWTAGKGHQDWSADYRLFSRDRWDAQGIFDSVIGGVLEFLCPHVPLVAAMDDTLLRKTGPKIPDVGYRRDPLSPAFHTNFVRGQRFLQVSAMLPARPDGPASARAIPIRFQPAPPLPKASKRDSQEQRTEVRKLAKCYNLSTIGRDAIAATRDQLDRQPNGKDRLLVVGVDGSYTNRTVLRDLPPRTTLIGRVRKDAKLFHPPDDSHQPARGRKRSYGQALPTPEELRKDESVPWREVSAVAAGKLHAFRVKTVGPVLWPKVGPGRPLRLVVIAPVGYRLRAGAKLLYRQPAYLLCTDPDMPLEELLQDYLWRWGIEVDHRDEKQLVGVGEAQVRAPYSARREPVFAVACYAKLLLAGTQRYGPDATQADLPLPKWRRNRPDCRVTTSDLLREIRQDLWADAIKNMERNFSHFVNNQRADTNCQKSPWPLGGAIDHAATG
jgi:hypothetical protein